MDFILYGAVREDILMMYDGVRTYFPAMGVEINPGFVRVLSVEKEKEYCSYIICENITTEDITLSDIRQHIGTEAYYLSTVTILENEYGNTVCKVVNDDGTKYYCLSRGIVFEILYKDLSPRFTWLEKMFKKEQVSDNQIIAEDIDIKEDYFLIESIIQPKDFFDASTISLINNKVVKITGADENRMYVKDNGVMLRLNESYHKRILSSVHEESGIKNLYDKMYKGMYITYNKNYRVYTDKPSDLDSNISTELWVNSMCYYRFDIVVDFIDLPCIKPECFIDISGYLDDILNYCKKKADLLDAERRKHLSDVKTKSKFNYKEIAKLR